MGKIKNLLKSFTCRHETMRIQHDWRNLRAEVTCARCGTKLSEFQLREQADTFQLAEGE